MSALALGLWAPCALAIDLSDNLSNASSGVETAEGLVRLAGAFATDASLYTLNSVTLILGNSVPGVAELSVYDDGGLEPGSLVGTLTSPDTYSQTPAETTFTAGGIVLEAGTTYWIVLTPKEGTFEWSWTGDNTGLGAGFVRTWGTSDDAGVSWWSIDIYPTQFRVRATPGIGCYADFNGDGVLDLFDFLGYVNAFNAGQGEADCNSDGALDLFDFLCFVNAFNGGC